MSAPLAWAIEIKPNGAYVGKFWWFGGVRPKIPEHMMGCRIALFETRRAARAALLDVRRSFPTARVQRVRVDIRRNLTELTK